MRWCLSRHRSVAGGDIKCRPEIANPTGVDTEVVSDIRHRQDQFFGTTSTKSLERSQLLWEAWAGDISTANDGMPNVWR